MGTRGFQPHPSQRGKQQVIIPAWEPEEHPLTGAVNLGQGTELAHSDPSGDSMRKKSPTSLPAGCLLVLPIGQRSRSAFWVGQGRVERRLELV